MLLVDDVTDSSSVTHHVAGGHFNSSMVIRTAKSGYRVNSCVPLKQLDCFGLPSSSSSRSFFALMFDISASTWLRLSRNSLFSCTFISKAGIALLLCDDDCFLSLCQFCFFCFKCLTISLNVLFSQSYTGFSLYEIDFFSDLSGLFIVVALKEF